MQTMLKSLYWILLQELSVKLISFITSIILLWYLSPSAFGSFFFVWLFFSGFAVWRTGGTQETIVLFGKDNSALWQAQFWQIQVKTIYSLILLVPLLIFDEFILGGPLSFTLWVLMSLIFILEGLYAVPQYVGELQKNFKSIFRWYVFAEIMASVTGIWLAYRGHGIYALMAKMIVSAAIKTAGMWMNFHFPLLRVVKTMPQEQNQFEKPLSITKSLNYMVRNIDDFMIGRYLGDAVLGLYNRVYNISLYPFLQLGSAVNRALLPEAGSVAKERHGTLFLNLFAFNLYTYSIATIALYWWCPIIVLQFLPDIWHPTAPLFKIFAGVLLLQGLSRPNSVFFALSGETQLELKWNVILKINTIIWLSIGVFLYKDIEMVVWCYLAAVVISAILQWIVLDQILTLPKKWWKPGFQHFLYVAICWIVFQKVIVISPYWIGLFLMVAVILKWLIFDRDMVFRCKQFFDIEAKS